MLGRRASGGAQFGKPLDQYERSSPRATMAPFGSRAKTLSSAAGGCGSSIGGLSHEIRRKVVAHAQVREREHREVKPSAGAPAIAAAPVVIAEQLSFFDRLKARLAR
jgi:hypothetical protein